MKPKNNNANAMIQEARQSIIDNLNLAGLVKFEQDQVIGEFMGTVASMATTAAWDRLSEDNKSELQEIAKFGRGKTLDYLAAHLEGFQALVEDATRQTMADFKEKRAASQN